MKEKKVVPGCDREVVAAAQFRTGAGPMRVAKKDPHCRRRRNRQEEKEAKHGE